MHVSVRNAGDALCSYVELITDHPRNDDTYTDGDQLYGIFYTGGATDTPRGVMLSHNNVISAVMGARADEAVMRPYVRLLHAAPMDSHHAVPIERVVEVIGADRRRNRSRASRLLARLRPGLLATSAASVLQACANHC